MASVTTKRTIASEGKPAEVASLTYEVLNLSTNFAVWFAKEKIPLPPNDKTNVMTARVLETKRLNRVYLVEAIGNKNEKGVYSALDVTLVPDVNIVFRRGQRPDVPVVAHHSDYNLFYPYPPRSIQSLLFFILNPSVEAEARRLAKEAETSSEAEDGIVALGAVLLNLPKNVSGVEISYSEPFDGTIKVVVDIHFEPVLKALRKVGLLSEYFGVWEVSYDIGLEIEGTPVTYNINHVSENNTKKAIKFLLEKFVPESELDATEKILKDVKTGILKAFLHPRYF